GREAGPIVAPAVPARCPADAWAHGTRRPDETTAWRRGQRARAGLAASQSTRTIGPMPGTAGRWERGGAWGGVAVWTRGNATARRRRSSWSSRARSPSPRGGTAGAGHRAATPSRWALEASGVPSAARGYGLVVGGRCARRAAR